MVQPQYMRQAPWTSSLQGASATHITKPQDGSVRQSVSVPPNIQSATITATDL